jgi:hypothetical protein
MCELSLRMQFQCLQLEVPRRCMAVKQERERHRSEVLTFAFSSNVWYSLGSVSCAVLDSVELLCGVCTCRLVSCAVLDRVGLLYGVCTRRLVSSKGGGVIMEERTCNMEV